MPTLGVPQDGQILFDQMESFAGGVDMYRRATLIDLDQMQNGINVLMRENYEARTRPGADALGGAPVVNVATGIPTDPIDLSAFYIGGTTVQLGWVTSLPDTVTYSVYRSTVNGFTPAIGNRIASGQIHTYYTDTTVLPSTTYYYIVIADGSMGQSGQSNQAVVVIGGNSIVLSANVISGTEIDLSWSTATGTGVTYSVYRSLTPDFTPDGTNIIASGLSATTYNDTGVIGGNTYYYFVYGFNSLSQTIPSNYVSASTVAAPVLTNPGNQSLVVGDSVNLQLSATNSPTSYACSNLPDGLSLNTSTGLITGTVTTAQSKTSSATATNSGGTSNPQGFDWYVSEAIIPVLTGYAFAGGQVSASSDFDDGGGNGLAWAAFDGSDTTFWDANPPAPEELWIQIQFDTPRVVTSYYMDSGEGLTSTPTDWLFQGSNDGVSWTTLDTQTGIAWTNDVERKEFSFSNTQSFTYYRPLITLVLYFGEYRNPETDFIGGNIMAEFQVFGY